MSMTIFTPGRTELSGNHTDHQQGRILASAVDVGLTAIVDKGGRTARIDSEGFAPFEADIDNLEVIPEDYGTSKALMRGMLACFRENGLEIVASSEDLYAEAADFDPCLTEVQTFYESMFREQGYPIKYLCFKMGCAPFKSPQDFDPDYWRSVEGHRTLFGRDTAETRRQKLKGR